MPDAHDDEELLFTGHRFEVRRVSRQLRDGTPLTREIIRHPGSVVILPCVDLQQVCLIRNERISAGDTLIELPAGTREGGEPAHDCALRELHEETGYRCGCLRELTSFYAAPGILDEYMHLFLAEDLTADLPHREADEQIDNWIVTWEEALDLVRHGEIRDAKTIAGLLFGYFVVRGPWANAGR